MRKRAQTLDSLPHGCDNIEYHGLRRGQIVTVRTKEYNGLAQITGTPPQGPGIYLRTPTGKRLWLIGEDIIEATEPT